MRARLEGGRERERESKKSTVREQLLVCRLAYYASSLRYISRGLLGNLDLVECSFTVTNDRDYEDYVKELSVRIGTATRANLLSYFIMRDMCDKIVITIRHQESSS